MFELFMYVYSYCNALSARFFAVDRALNSYFMIMIMTMTHNQTIANYNNNNNHFMALCPGLPG